MWAGGPRRPARQPPRTVPVPAMFVPKSGGTASPDGDLAGMVKVVLGRGVPRGSPHPVLHPAVVFPASPPPKHPVSFIADHELLVSVQGGCLCPPPQHAGALSFPAQHGVRALSARCVPGILPGLARRAGSGTLISSTAG